MGNICTSHKRYYGLKKTRVLTSLGIKRKIRANDRTKTIIRKNDCNNILK